MINNNINYSINKEEYDKTLTEFMEYAKFLNELLSNNKCSDFASKRLEEITLHINNLLANKNMLIILIKDIIDTESEKRFKEILNQYTR